MLPKKDWIIRDYMKKCGSETLIVAENRIIKVLKDPLRNMRYKLWIEMDRIRGIDFTEQVDLNDLNLSSLRSSRYHAVTPRLKRLLRNMDISQKDEFLDLGCGKGKALYFASKCGFGKIWGLK